MYRKEKGQALIFLVLGIVALVSITSLAIDGGAALANRRNAQNAADNAAMAAALAITQGNDPYAAAYQVAAANGYDNNGTDNTVTINISTNYADIDGTAVSRNAAYFQDNTEFYIKVTIDSQSPTSIAKVVGKDDIEAHASAVSHAIRGVRQPLYNGNALVVLSPNERDSKHHHHQWGTLEIHGHVALDIEDSGIFVNSSSDRALTVKGHSTIDTDTGISIVGGALIRSHPVVIDGYTVSSSNPYPPTITVGVPQRPVPPDYSFIPEPPAPPSCSGLPTITQSTWSDTHTTLQPGNYINGITMSGSVDQLTMASGVYCINDHFELHGGINVDGGSVQLVPQSNFDFQIDGHSTLDFDNLEYYPEDGDLIINGGSILNADRFRFYASGDASFVMNGHGHEHKGQHDTGETFTSGNAFFYLPGGTVAWHGGASLNMHAPPEDDPDGFGGLLIYKPWENTQPVTFHGGNAINLVGSLIMPHTDMTIHGHTSVEAIDTQIVVYTMVIHGKETVHIQYNEANQYQAPVPPVVELLE